MGKKVKVTCKLCGNVLSRYSTFNLWCHLIYHHNLSDFVQYDRVTDKKGVCRFCNNVISYDKPWGYDLHEHLQEAHTFNQFFNIEPYTHIEIIEFHCEHCYRRKTSHHFTCWMDREAYEKNWVIPICQWCKQPMSLRRKKEKDKYEN